MPSSFARPLLASALTLVSLFAVGCDEDPLDAEAIADLETKADQLIAAGVPGVVVVVRAGDQVIQIARGVSDLGTGAPMTPAHRFRVASIAKTVVASVILQLVDEGTLGLGDRLDRWLPALAPASGAVTVEQLLRQESGIFDFFEDPRVMAPYFAGNFEHTWTPEQLVGMATEHAPLFAPGTRHMYSNTNYTVLGLIIERVTAVPLANVVQQRVTGPHGLTSSTMATGTHLDAPFARGYLVGMGAPIDVTGISASHVFGNGNLVSTAADLTAFYDALVDGRVVAPDLLPAMFTPNPNVPPTTYAMGTNRVSNFLPCGTFVGHDGGIAGYDSTVYAKTDGSRQLSVLVNSMTVDSKVGTPQAQEAFRALVMAAGCN